MWHKVNIKQNKTGLISEFSSFLTGGQTKAKEPSRPTNYPLLGEEQMNLWLS